MRLLLLVTAIAALPLGCSSPASAPSGVEGSEADVRTALGASGGHDVAMCTRIGPGRLVRGLGSSGYQGSTPADKTISRLDAVEAFMNERIRPALAAIASVWGTGVGLSCRDDAPIGGSVDLSSWRDVDRVIAAVSAVLDAEHVDESVSIVVNGIPIADVE